jgi:four helix bundle protein
LDAWVLANEVRREILALTDRPDVKRDFDFCDQARRAANSACKNTAEGFHRYKHPEFANFVNIAKGSLGELFDSLHEARMKRYIDDREYGRLHQMVDRAHRCACGLHTHLRGSDAP